MVVTPYDALYREYAAEQGIPFDVVQSVALTENGAQDPSVIGDAGHSYGLFQIYDRTARQRGFSGDLHALLDPKTNTEFATAYMRDIIDDQGGLEHFDPAAFYSEYNSGSATLWQQSAEVFAHVQRFLSHYSVAAESAGAGVLVAIGGLSWWLWKRRKQR